MDRIWAWCDQAELWVAGLPFAAQLPVVLVVLVPLSFGLAWLLDGSLTLAGQLAAPRKTAPPADGDAARDHH